RRLFMDEVAARVWRDSGAGVDPPDLTRVYVSRCLRFARNVNTGNLDSLSRKPSGRFPERRIASSTRNAVTGQGGQGWLVVGGFATSCCWGWPPLPPSSFCSWPGPSTA